MIYVAACYPVGTGMCHNMVGLLQHYLGAGGEGQEKEAGGGGAGGDDIKICIDFAYF